MAKIHIIGGGELRQMEEINAAIALDLPRTEGKKPVITFFPQASAESKPYVNSFYKQFGSRLKCKANCALWSKGEMERDYVAEKMRNADAIYIGGGKYDVLKKAFDDFNMRELLIEAIASDKTIIGNSAGAMILYERAVSDYLITEDSGDYSIVEGYGLIKGGITAHADEERRVEFAVANGMGGETFIRSYECKTIIV